MSAAYDALKLLRILCRRRSLDLEVERDRERAFVVVTQPGTEWCFRATEEAVAVFRQAHSAVLKKFPSLSPKGGAHSTRETRAAGRARVQAEQRAALEGRA